MQRESKGAREGVARGESELNDLASRLLARHVSQSALLGLRLCTVRSAACTLKLGNHAYGSSDCFIVIVMNPCCALCLTSASQKNPKRRVYLPLRGSIAPCELLQLLGREIQCVCWPVLPGGGVERWPDTETHWESQRWIKKQLVAWSLLWAWYKENFFVSNIYRYLLLCSLL